LNMIVAKIKEEVSLWRFTRANAVTNVTLWEYACCLDLVKPWFVRLPKTFFLSNENDKSFALFQKKKILANTR
jgi:hypothetical protein